VTRTHCVNHAYYIRAGLSNITRGSMHYTIRPPPLWYGARKIWAESAFFGILPFLVKLTPAMPNLVEKRRRNQFWPHLWLGKTFLHVFLVDFGSLRPSGAIGVGFRSI
jgi:hypothetical protein